MKNLADGCKRKVLQKPLESRQDFMEIMIMPDALLPRQFQARLLRVEFPGVNIKNNGAFFTVAFPDAGFNVSIREKPEICPTRTRETRASPLRAAQREFHQLFSNGERFERSVGDAVVGMKADGKY